METAFVSLICIALMVIGGMTMSQGFLRSVDNTSSNIQVITQRDQDILRTNVEILEAAQTESATILEVTLRNSGQTKLVNFDKWDIIVHYRDSGAIDHIKWLPYTTGALDNNQWLLEGIYMDAGTLAAEVFEPGILNPDEEIIIRCKLNPGVGLNTVNLISITTPNGITVSKAFNGYIPE
jgi:hypothetical protein